MAFLDDSSTEEEHGMVKEDMHGGTAIDSLGHELQGETMTGKHSQLWLQ